jgi:site-specific DNA recombinase
MFAPLIPRVKLCLWFSSLVLAYAVAAGAGSDGVHANVRVGSQSSGCSVVRRAGGHLVRHLASVPLAVGAAQPVPRRRRLRVVLYARYSTDEQNPLSVDDQIGKCRQYVSTLGLGDVEFVVLKDSAISGEHTSRPGIDRVWELIEAKSCDVIVAEDVSRLYRHATRALQLIEAAVDADIRVIAINSHVDTAEDRRPWRMSGIFSAMQAEFRNDDTRDQIIRALEARWGNGCAVGSLKPGYVRIPTTPATQREPARGPFRDQKDAQWTPVITRAYEVCAAKDAPWVIAKYLTEAGFPKSARARLPQWTEENVIRFIRDPIYRGEESYGVRHNERRFKEGTSVQVLTPSEDVLRRDMPHLAHVPRWLWEADNLAIDDRNTNKNPKRGKEHQLHGIPHDSRGPVSQIFVCGVCGAKMYRTPQCYRCADSRPQPNLKRQGAQRCWNRCVPQTQTVHHNLATAIVDTLLAQQGCFNALCTEVARLVQHGTPETERRITELQKQVASLARACNRLAEAVEADGDLQDLLIRLRERQAERDQVRGEIERLVEQNELDVPVPTEEDVRRLLDDLKAKLLGDLGREVGPLLRRLIDGEIRAMPYKLFDRDSLHLRAHFRLNLLGLVPAHWGRPLADRVAPEDLKQLAQVHSVPLVVDLFKRPPRVVHAPAVYKMVSSGLTIAEAARQLALPETTANRAYRTGKAMTELGLEDAYVKLESMPKRPSRWRPHSNRPDVFDAT